MSEEHFDLLSQLHRDVILAGLGDVTRDLTGVFMFFAGDGTGISIWTAIRFGRAGLAGQFQCAVFGSAFAAWPPVRIRIVATELFQNLAFGANV